MRALGQRVSEASVSVNGAITGQIKLGLLVFVGVGKDDSAERAIQLANKVVHLRIFPDSDGKMNRCLGEVDGELLVVSQFTLYGETSKGNRPSYSNAAGPDKARELYESFVEACRHHVVRVATGVFQAHMQVRLINDGPVTLMCYSGE